jgi:hypothetical protein
MDPKTFLKKFKIPERTLDGIDIKIVINNYWKEMEKCDA